VTLLINLFSFEFRLSTGLGNHLNQSKPVIPTSGAAFSSSFAPANEPRRIVEESLFD